MRKHLSYITFLLIFGIYSQVYAQTNETYWLDGKWPHEKSSLPKHDTALYGKLSNGFRYIIQHNTNPKNKVSVQLLVQAGSLMENDKERGIAHFLEHLAYNGSKNFPAGKLIPFFQSNGMSFGKDVNAYTSLKETVYKLNILNKEQSINDAFVFMHDVAEGILISPKEVEAERGVIISEKNSRDSEQYRMRQRLREFLYNGTEFEHDTIGQESIINSVTPQTIKDFYDAWYQPQHMILLVVGSISPEEIETLIQKKFSDLQARAPKRTIFPLKDVMHNGVLAYHDTYQSEGTTLQIKAHDRLHWQNDSLAVQEQMLYTAMANSILSARLRTMITEGKAPFLKAAARHNEVFGLYPTADIFATTEAKSWKEGFEQLQNALLVALKFGFLPQEVKETKQIFLRNFERSMHLEKQELNDDIIKNMIGCFMQNRVYQSAEQTFAMYEALIQKVTAEKLHEALVKSWEVDNRILSVTGDARIDDAQNALTALWNAGLQKELSPTQEIKAMPYPYIALPKAGGTVQSQKSRAITNTELHLHEIQYANGLLVRIIPSKFSQGKVSMQLALGAGTDAIADDAFVQAQVATNIDTHSGFGNLAAYDVRRLAGAEGITVKSSLEQAALVISSEGESKNLEKNLEAFWTQYKDPSINAQDRSIALRNYGLADAKRGKDLNSALHLASVKLFWGESVRNMPITQAMAGEYSLEKEQDTLKKLYAGGAPVLNIVGDVDVKKTLDIIEKSFGSDEVTWPALAPSPYGIPYAFASSGKKEEHIELNSPLNQAAVRLAFHRNLDDVLDRKTLVTRRLVSTVLGDVMRKAIREKYGASYSPQVLYWVDDKTGYGMYRINISTQHENFAQMRKEIPLLIETFAREGVDNATLERMKKPTIGSWRQYSKQNKVYTSLLSLMARRDRPYVQWHEDFVPMVQSITVEEINTEIKQAFTKENRVILTGITVN